ncbi:MAG: sterol desaturase family protein [Gammaproteobacteria bacterium]|nr:sterol desaturase family protein [Gammaproteobacteria bacterium]
MNTTDSSAAGPAAGIAGHRPPDLEQLPPLFHWPPRIKESLLWLWHDAVFPFGVLFFALAAVTWRWLTPDLAAMAEFRPGWMFAVWLRNAMLLGAVAGGLHWWLYIRRGQGDALKYDRRWPAQGNRAFLWGDQVKDNMFWSLASGSVIWSLYECATLWLYAGGRVPTVAWSEAPWYLATLAALVFFWGSLHFYLIHRLLHWPPLYRLAHELHHRNVNIGPWSGISMHPVEHLLYFSPVVLWWVVPADPVIIIATGFFTGLGPAFSHAGFERVRIGAFSLPAGAYHHQLHHRHFDINYGNPRAPMDALFGTWHNGGETAQAQLLARRRR